MVEFSENLGNVEGRKSAAGHKIHGHGYHSTEKQGLFLAGRTSGVSLVAAGCGEAALSAAVTEELGLFLGSCAEEMESEVQTSRCLCPQLRVEVTGRRGGGGSPVHYVPEKGD